MAAAIAREASATGFELKSHQMRPLDIDKAHRVPAPAAKLKRMAAWATKACWFELAQAVVEHGFVFEQESQEA